MSAKAGQQTGQQTGQQPKPLVWLHGEVKTPPFNLVARIEAGKLLRRLQNGENIGMPHSRPMPSIGAHVHELRIRQTGKNWRIIYRIDSGAILIVEVFNKTTRETPQSVIEVCKAWLNTFDNTLDAGR